MKDLDHYLKTLLYDLGLESGLGSIDQLYWAARRECQHRVTRKQIKDFLSSQDVYTLHKPARKRYKRNQILTITVDEIYELDLVDLTHLSKYNNGYRYLLTWTDVFSKYAWVFPLKNKTGKALVEALKK